MLTIITGTPGAGKSLYAVWEECRKVPGSTVEATNGVAVPRRLLTNIKDLCIEHELIDAKSLDTWHEWSKPGDVIVFDEVQEVWRPRALGQAKIPDCIAALETHRHRGVDMILITQHPMLVDANIRRLVNRHLHLRRISRTVAYLYEWDHCANPGNVKTCMQSRVWFHPKKAYALYKSAQLHTKPTARIPRIAYLGLAALAGLAYIGPVAYGKLKDGASATPLAVSSDKGASGPVNPASAPALPPASPGAPVGAVGPLAAASEPKAPVVAGCAAAKGVCRCYDGAARRLVLPAEYCVAETSPGPVQLTSVPVLDEHARRVDRNAAADMDVLAWMARRHQRASY